MKTNRTHTPDAVVSTQARQPARCKSSPRARFSQWLAICLGAGIFLVLAESAHAGGFNIRRVAGNIIQPYQLVNPAAQIKKTEEQVKNLKIAAEAAKKAVDSSSAPPADKENAKKDIDKFHEQAKTAIDESVANEKESGETTASLLNQRYQLGLTACGLIVTNIVAACGWLFGRTRRNLEIEKLKLEIDEKKLAIAKARQPGTQPDTH